MLDDIKKKMGQILGHPITRKFSALGEDVLQVTYQLAANKNIVSLSSAAVTGLNIIANALDVPIESASTYFINKNNLQIKIGTLHKLLLRSGVQNDFNVTVALSTDTLSIMKLDFLDDDVMYWISGSSSISDDDGFAEGSSIHNQYFLSENFNMKKVNNFFWDKYKTGMSFSYNKSSDGGVELSALPVISTYEDAGEHSVSQMIDYIKKSKELNLSRSFLLYGEPGTGKTSWVEKISEQFGSKFVKLDSAILQSLSSPDIENILDMLGPEIILFDDFDRINIEVYEGAFLYIIENIKRKYANITFFATVNDPNDLSPALLRPGRFDEKLEFKLNDSKSSLKILQKYAEVHGLKIDQGELVKAIGKGNFTPAECKEAISRKILKEDLSFEDIFKNLLKYRGFGGEEPLDTSKKRRKR